MKKTNYIPLLPHGAVKRIHEDSGKAVSYRQTQRILSGECDDSHGIIELAIAEAEAYKKRRKALKKISVPVK